MKNAKSLFEIAAIVKTWARSYINYSIKVMDYGRRKLIINYRIDHKV